MQFEPVSYLISVAFLEIVIYFSPVISVGCYVCTSINGTNPACEDTFMGADRYYVDNCQNRRHRRTGAYPSQYCIKFEAEDMEYENYTVMVRDCAVDDGGINVDTEIGRMSHCGWVQHVYYNGRYMRGCISTCRHDGCNSAPTQFYSVVYSISAALISLYQ